MKTISIHAQLLFEEAGAYVKTIETTLNKKSKFNNELLYQISAMCFEKYCVAMLAYHNHNATHHMPTALVQELTQFITVPEGMKQTAKLMNKFESICSLTDFGYKAPNDDELKEIVKGIVDIKLLANSMFSN